MVVTHKRVALASGFSTACTCVASSRVGTSTSPRGRPARVRPPASRAASGSAKPSVLPEPVCARPRMSRPASASGSVAAWMGKGVVMPSPSSTATSGAGTPRDANVAAGTAQFSAGRAVKRNRLQGLRWSHSSGGYVDLLGGGRVNCGATSVETDSLTERPIAPHSLCHRPTGRARRAASSPAICPDASVVVDVEGGEFAWVDDEVDLGDPLLDDGDRGNADDGAAGADNDADRSVD